MFTISDLLKNLSPSFYPGFSFAWLELISHRDFLPFFLNNQPSHVGILPQQNQLFSMQSLGLHQGIDQ